MTEMRIRPLEKEDLIAVHELNNLKSVMSYWFEEPYESFGELQNLYNKHIDDDTERRFVIEVDDIFAGIVELIEISYIHRNCEIQIALFPDHQGHGYAKEAMKKGIDYAFNFLNLNKVCLYVDVENEKAIHIYKALGFQIEGRLIQQFFAAGQYHDSYFMGLLRNQA